MENHPRSEQLVQPLGTILLRPMDDARPSAIYVATAAPTNDGRAEITPYFSSNGLSLETIKVVRKELGMPLLKSQEDLDRELQEVIMGQR